MEDNAPHRPQDREPGLDAPAGRAADERNDPELDELAALEMQVDNWLRSPAKAETVAPEPRLPVEEPQPEPGAADLSATDCFQTVVPAQAGTQFIHDEHGMGFPPPRERRIDLAALPPEPELRQRSEPPPVSGEPPVTPSGVSRGLKRTLFAMLGLGAVGAAIGAAMLLNEPAQPARAPQSVAAPARMAAPAPVALPAQPEPAPLVFLDEDEGGRAVPPAPPSAAGDKTNIVTPEPVAPKKAVVKKKKEAVVAKSSAPAERRSRRLTDAERVEAAVAECRAKLTRPGGCNIRVCDVLGSAHPACRE